MEIFIVNISNLGDRIDEFSSILSSEELLLASGIKHSTSRGKFIISKSVVRKILAGTEQLSGVLPKEIEIKKGPNGKPYVVGNPVHYNVSHSKDLLVVAVDSADIGVDVEFMRERNFASLSRYYFNDDGCITKTEFYLRWTLAEAEAKLAGVGIFNSKQRNGQLTARYRNSCQLDNEYSDYMLAVASNEHEIPSNERGCNIGKICYKHPRI